MPDEGAAAWRGPLAAARPPRRHAWGEQAARIFGWLVIWVPLGAAASSVVLFTIWTTWVSFTPSTLLPEYGWVGFRNYAAMLRTQNLQVAYVNLVIFGTGFVLLTAALGVLLAILLDQRVRGEDVFRTIFLYPLALSFVVTGTVWSWLLNPGFGFPKLIQGLGWTSFRFDWLIDPDRAIYLVIFAAAWQGAGFVMALVLAGLRSVDNDLLRAAQIDGAGAWRTYRRVVLPTIWPILLTAMAILLQFAVKTYDLVRALTDAGPGISTTLPAFVVYDFMFQRGELGRGAAVAVLMLLSLLLVMAPFGLIRALRRRREARL